MEVGPRQRRSEAIPSKFIKICVFFFARTGQYEYINFYRLVLQSLRVFSQTSSDSEELGSAKLRSSAWVAAEAIDEFSRELFPDLDFRAFGAGTAFS